MFDIFLVLSLLVSNIVSLEVNCISVSSLSDKTNIQHADLLELKYTEMLDLMLTENTELSARLDEAEVRLSLARNKLRDAERQLDRLG